MQRGHLRAKAVGRERVWEGLLAMLVAVRCVVVASLQPAAPAPPHLTKTILQNPVQGGCHWDRTRSEADGVKERLHGEYTGG